MNSDKIIKLPLELKGFELLKRETINDNSSFLHAFLQSKYIFYGITDEGNKRNNASKKELVLNLRKELAEKLNTETKNPLNPDKKINHYEALFGGKMEQLSRSINQYTKAQYIAKLEQDYPFSNEYHEFISNILKTDIYLWDITEQELCHDSTINSLLYKRRDSVILAFDNNSYYTIGLLEKDKSITTHFDSGHALIKLLYQKIITDQEDSSESDSEESS